MHFSAAACFRMVDAFGRRALFSSVESGPVRLRCSSVANCSRVRCAASRACLRFPPYVTTAVTAFSIRTTVKKVQFQQ